MTRIDSHHHLWLLERGDHKDWLTPDIEAIHRDAKPEDIASLIGAAGIERTIAVQGAEDTGETDFLLEIAAWTPFIAGVVGWVDFESDKGVADIERLSSDPNLVGLRPMLQDVEDTRWLFRDAVQPAIGAMKAGGLTFDALVRPRHLPDLAEWAAAHPDLPIVIDHAAKPLIAWRQYDFWSERMRLAAARPNVHCKISGMINNAGTAWDAEKLKPYVELLLEAFGPDRLMFGSDWPMVDLSGDYSRWVEAVETLTARLSPDEQAQIFGGTAARFYGVGDD
jgi:L-fuconolactonase